MSLTTTLLIVPGLRDPSPRHWQTLLAVRVPGSRSLPPLGRAALDVALHCDALEQAVRLIAAPVILVAHSAGCLTVAHWAQHTRCEIRGALLAVPPDFDTPLPEGYPSPAELDAGGWLPVPRDPLPFPSLVAASRDDPLATFDHVVGLAGAWGSRLVDLGSVGHLNPASGYGPWPQAEHLIDEIAAFA
ncbi:MAG TPA: alpha/beta hydrolase [Burkholderiaceae bacterium]|nr:alpha/beta hydrolase [Burkholderiaceae bacterium]